MPPPYGLRKGPPSEGTRHSLGASPLSFTPDEANFYVESVSFLGENS